MGKRGDVGEQPVGLALDLVNVDNEEFGVFVWEANPGRDACGLTSAERAVLDLIVGGASNAEIAKARVTSVRTVANQVASLLRKLQAESRFDLIRRFGASHGARGTR